MVCIEAMCLFHDRNATTMFLVISTRCDDLHPRELLHTNDSGSHLLRWVKTRRCLRCIAPVGVGWQSDFIELYYLC